MLSVWTGDGHPLTEVGCDDDGASPQAMLDIPLVAGETYYIRIHGWGGTSGNVALSVEKVVSQYKIFLPIIDLEYVLNHP